MAQIWQVIFLKRMRRKVSLKVGKKQPTLANSESWQPPYLSDTLPKYPLLNLDQGFTSGAHSILLGAIICSLPGQRQ